MIPSKRVALGWFRAEAVSGVQPRIPITRLEEMPTTHPNHLGTLIRGWGSRAILALFLLVPGLGAQGVTGADPSVDLGGPAPGPSVFDTGGGLYTPPPDSGGPPGTPPGTPSGTTPPSPPPGLPRSRLSGRGAGARSGLTRAGFASRGGVSDRSASTASFITDSWDVWWETNKFDFIRLQRVEDAITATQGNERETPAEREIRLAAVRSTVRVKILPVLRELTGSEDPAVRSAAIVSLAKLRDESCVDLATRMLADGSLQVRRSAMLALGVLTSGRASWVLMNIATDNSTGQDLLRSSPISVDDRGTALLAATLRGDMAVAQLLDPLLNERGSAHPELLAMAADAAGLMGSTDAIRPLIDMAFDTQLPEFVRSAATSALGRIGDPSVTPALMKLLDTGVEPRRAAAAALGLVAHPGATKVIERLTGMLEDETDAVSRHFAAVSLGRIGGADARKALRSAFVSQTLGDDMRPWVALGLGLTERDDPGDSVVPLLVKQLKREANSSTTAAYAVALGLCRSEQAMPTLLEMSHNKRTDVAGYAAISLGLSGQPGAATRLREMLSTESNPLVIRQAAMGLGILGDRASITDLLELIRTTNNPFVASFAAIGIGFTGDSNAAGPLLDLIEREGPSGVTTTFAVAAVGQLFDRDRRPALSRLASGDNYTARTTAVGTLLALGF